MKNSILRVWENQDSEHPFDLFFEAAPVMMHAMDQTGTLLRVSRFWADRLGYDIDEMVGRRSIEFLTEASRAAARDIHLPEFFRSGKIDNVEVDFLCKDQRVLPVRMSALAEYDGNGAFVRSLVIMFDNSEAKRVAMELRQQQRLDAIGGLVGGVAHDFNNMLAIIIGNLEFLDEDPDSEDRGEFIKGALKAARRGAHHVQQLVTFGRRAQLSPSVVDVNEVARRSDRLIRRLIPANITLNTVTSAGLWRTNADVALLETAILNIVNNACDAMPGGGRITVETGNVRISQDYVATYGDDLVPGRYVMLAISDTGSGMGAETLSKIFEPFFSTKHASDRSGLGLSMVFGFMEQSNGAVRAYSEKGVGTTLRLYFPAVAVDGKQPEMEVTERPIDTSKRVVLLAEDDNELRGVLRRQLCSDSHSVVECTNGDEAIKHIAQGLRPDVLVTDIVMPGSLQGPELAQAVRQSVPGVGIIYISGYPAEAAIHANGLSKDDVHFLKPVNAPDLIEAVRNALNDTASGNTREMAGANANH